jgi:hypothetical protein
VGGGGAILDATYDRVTVLAVGVGNSILTLLLHFVFLNYGVIEYKNKVK